MEYPLYINGTKCGTLTVTREKLHLAFYAECELMPQLVRISVFGGGKSAYLGVMEPKGDRLVLRRRKSRNELRDFPTPIEYAADAEIAPERDNDGTVWRRADNGTLVSEKYIALPSDMRRKTGIVREIGGRQYAVFPGKRK